MEYSRILIRATNWVGDAVMSLPALRAIRERFPLAHIAILAKPWVADLYTREKLADEVIPYTAASLMEKWRVAKDLRGRRFDCAILLQNAFEAALLAWVARIPHRIGYARDGRGPLLTRSVAVPKPGEIPPHQRFYYLELLRRAGIIDRLPDALPSIGGVRIQATPIIGVSPGAAYGKAKRWLPDRFAEAATRLAHERGAAIALFGSKSERALCEEVASLVAGISVTNYAGQTSLAEFMDMASRCELFLTNDSGAMHIASALGIPTVAVFGATDDIATGPTGGNSRVVREAVECSPCLLRECPIDHRCMTRVSAGRVVQESLDLLANQSRS
ncbi:MAG: lipopolysaccharide heptosyltransferase II [Acidobacteriota bacterium]|nr:lipopolysaccharide heptosyltransferase II [Acidobacteriota bacterium]